MDNMARSLIKFYTKSTFGIDSSPYLGKVGPGSWRECLSGCNLPPSHSIQCVRLKDCAWYQNILTISVINVDFEYPEIMDWRAFLLSRQKVPHFPLTKLGGGGQNDCQDGEEFGTKYVGGRIE